MSYRLLSYVSPEGPRAGILLGEQIFDAGTISANPRYSTVLGILDDWDAADPFFASLSETATGGQPLSATKLLAPILYPGQIWAAGANYQDHIGEMGEDSEYKAVNAKTVSGGRAWHFMKSARGAVIGHGAVHSLPSYSSKVDWEIELAVVIGREGKNIAAANALDYVAGYTIANDLSARDNVVREGIDPASPFRFDWLSHKGFDGACPMGPWIVPARNIPDPHDLDLRLWIDDELMQDSNTKHMIFDIGEQIEEISARVTIFPGDVIMTGTPSGVGMSRGMFLKSGQKLKLWIEGIGELHHAFA